MKQFRSSYFALVVLLALGMISSCTRRDEPKERQKQVDTRAEEAAIRAAVADWSKAVGGKDLSKAVSFYAPDAVIMYPGMPPTSGAEAIRKAWTGLLAMPGFAMSFATTKVEVAASGDLAYELGTYEFTSNDKNGRPHIEKGKYADVWKKQPDGQWKDVVDIFNADQ